MTRLLKPAYKLTIGRQASGGSVIDTTAEPQASTVVALTVTLDMDAPADSLTLLMGQVGSLRLGREHQLTVELGYTDDGELTQVMHGGVVRVEPGLLTRRVVAHSAAEHLLRAFVDKTYENKTAGQIVQDLADQAGVTVARAEAGITFPAYVVDGRRNFYRHMHHLAGLCGFDLYFDAANELVFKKFTGGEAVHVLEYSQHILSLDVWQGPPAAAQVEAWGESPGAAQGGESWAWLTKDFGGLKGSAGSDPPVRLLEEVVLRTGQAARTAAQALQADMQRQTVSARLQLAGRPQLKLGDAVRLQGLPETALNASYQVRSVTHRITKQHGFTTTVEVRSL